MKFGPPKLSDEAKAWDKKFASPKKSRCKKAEVIPYQQPACVECGDVLVEDLPNGIMVCHNCGLTERILMGSNPSYLDVDWHGASMVTRSQHVPIKYFLELLKRFDIRQDLTEELTQQYTAVIFWSKKFKPEGRKSLPN